MLPSFLLSEPYGAQVKPGDNFRWESPITVIQLYTPCTSRQCPGSFNSLYTLWKPVWMVLSKVRQVVSAFFAGALMTHMIFIKDDIVTNITYIPPVPHSRPTTFQAMLRIPPRKTIDITMDVTKAFLRYTEHPPDAQRGWDLPPAIFTPVEFENNSLSFLPQHGRIYTSTLLVDLATPDFSMPYNVIIFTCTLTAAIFGNVFNLLTRKFLVVHVDPDKTH